MARSRRRARGEGSVFQRKDGYWVAQIELGDGKRKQYYLKTQKEAMDKWDGVFNPTVVAEEQRDEKES